MAIEPKVSVGRALEILGLNEGATKDDIKKAYKNQARMCHPDKNSEPNATEKFQELSNAYRTLTTRDNHVCLDDIFADDDYTSGSDDEDCADYFDDKELFFILLQDLLFRRRFSYTSGPFGFADHSQDNSHSNYFRPRWRETSHDQYSEKYDKWEKRSKPSTGTRFHQDYSSNNHSSQAGFSDASTSDKPDQVNDDEDAELYDFLKRERRTDGDDEDLDPDEVVKKYKSYEEWKKAKKQKKKLKLPPKPRPLTKRQQQNQQFRRDKEMQEIQAELLKMNLEVEEKEKSRREKEGIKKQEEEVAEVQRKKEAAAETTNTIEHREKKEEKKRKTAKKKDVVQDEHQKQILERQKELERQRNLNEMQKIQEAEAERRRNTVTHRTNQAHQRQYVNSSVKRQKFNATHQSQTAVPKQTLPPASKSYDSAPYCRSSNNRISPLETSRPPADNAWLQGPPLIATADGTVQAKVAPLVPAPNTPEEEEEMLRRAIELSMKEQIKQQAYLLNLCHNVESDPAIDNSGLWDLKDSGEGDFDQRQPLSVEHAKVDNMFDQKEDTDAKVSHPYRASTDFTKKLHHKPRKIQKWPPPKEENWDEEIADMDAPRSTDAPDITIKAPSCDWANTGARPKSRFHNRSKPAPSKWSIEHDNVQVPYVQTSEVLQANDKYNSELCNSSEIKTGEVDSQVKITVDRNTEQEVSRPTLHSAELTVEDLQLTDEVLRSKEACVRNEILVPAQKPAAVNCETAVSKDLYSEQVASNHLAFSKLTEPIICEQPKLPSPLYEPATLSPVVPDVTHELSPEQCRIMNTGQVQVPSSFHADLAQKPSELNKVQQEVPEGSQLLNGSGQFVGEQSHMPNIPVSQVEQSGDSAKVNVSTATRFTDNHVPLPHMPPFPDRMFYEQGGGVGLPFVASMPNIGMVPVPGMFNPYLTGAPNPLLQYLQSMNMVYGGLPSPIGPMPPLQPFPGIGPVTPVHVNPFVNYAFPYPQINNLMQNSNIPNMQFPGKSAEVASKDECGSAQVPSDAVSSDSSRNIPSVNSSSETDVALKDMTYQSDDESELESFLPTAVADCQNTALPAAHSDIRREVDAASASVNFNGSHGSELDLLPYSSQIPPVHDHFQSQPVSTINNTSYKESNTIDSKVNLYAKPFPSVAGRGNHHPVRLRGCLRARGARRNEPFSHQRNSPTKPTEAAQEVCSNPRPQFNSPYYEAEDTRAHRTKTTVFGSQKNQDHNVSKRGGHS